MALKVTNHEKIASLGLCTLMSAGSLYFIDAFLFVLRHVSYHYANTRGIYNFNREMMLSGIDIAIMSAD